jgi:hypothetical protein
VAQEKEVENKKKPQNQPVVSVVAEVLKQTASDARQQRLT